MSPLDWLRAKTKPKTKYATGGHVPGPKPDDPPPAPASPRREPREPSETEIEQLAEQLAAVLTQPLGPASYEQTQRLAAAKEAQDRQETARTNCPRIAIYSRCYPQFHNRPHQ